MSNYLYASMKRTPTVSDVDAMIHEIVRRRLPMFTLERQGPKGWYIRHKQTRLPGLTCYLWMLSPRRLAGTGGYLSPLGDWPLSVILHEVAHKYSGRIGSESDNETCPPNITRSLTIQDFWTWHERHEPREALEQWARELGCGDLVDFKGPAL